MKTGEYILVAVVLLLAVSVSASQLSSNNYSIDSGVVTDGGDNINSSNYISSVVVGLVSGTSGTTNYTSELGVFYGINSAPSVSGVTINTSLGTNTSSEDVLCNTIVSDLDGGTLTVQTQWYLDGGLNLTISEGSVELGAFSSTLDSGNITKNENWSCSIRVYDGIVYSGWDSSENITILNSAPVVELSSPVNGAALTDRTPTFNWTATDGDGDTMNYEINITAYYYDGDNPSDQGGRWNNSLTSTSYTPLTDLEMLSDAGLYYVWKVRANDSEEYGNWTPVRNFSISSTVSLSLVSSEIYLGSLVRGESSNTDDGPSPFVIRNDGTVFLNVSLNASALWDSVLESSSYYQYKADNGTEADSFSWPGSITSWTNVPFTGYVVAVNALNYEDSSDTVEIDINVTVPSEESYGVKNSTIIFKGELGE